MTLALTPEQSHAIHSGEVVRLTDPQSSTVYVLVPEDAFRRVQALFDDEPLSPDERRKVLAGVWRRAEWDDPVWDEYARLVPERPAQ